MRRTDGVLCHQDIRPHCEAPVLLPQKPRKRPEVAVHYNCQNDCDDFNWGYHVRNPQNEIEPIQEDDGARRYQQRESWDISEGRLLLRWHYFRPARAGEAWRPTRNGRRSPTRGGTRLNGTSASPPSVVARALANLDSTTLSSCPTALLATSRTTPWALRKTNELWQPLTQSFTRDDMCCDPGSAGRTSQ